MSQHDIRAGSPLVDVWFGANHIEDSELVTIRFDESREWSLERENLDKERLPVNF